MIPEASSDKQQDTISIVETIADIDELLAEAERIMRSDPVRLRELAVEIHEASLELAYIRGLAFAEFYRGMAARRTSDYEMALIAYQNALEAFQKINEEIGIRRSLRQIGLVHQTVDRHDQALEYFWRELELWERLEDSTGIAGTLINIAITYYSITQFDLALEHCFKALDLVVEQDANVMHAGIYVNVANVYMAISEYASAMEHQLRALEIYKKIDDKIGESRTLLNIGWNYFQISQYERALEYGQQALQQFEVLADREQKAIALLQIGQIYARLTMNREALEFLELSLQLAREVDNHRVSTDALRAIGDMYEKLGNMMLAEGHYTKALEIAVQIGNRQWEYELSELLAKLYEQLDQPQKSLQHYKQYIAIKDIVQDERRRQSISEMQMRFNVEKSEREKEIYRLKNIELADALGKVELLNEHLADINSEKNELLGIVAHDLKNPISGLSMSLSLLSNYLPRMSQEEIVRQVGTMNKTVQRMETIVSKLLDLNILDSGKIVFYPAAFDLNEAVCSIMDDYGDRMREKNIAARFDLADCVVPAFADRSAVLEVLDNLISNAVKYSPRDTVITVRSHVYGGKARFEVEDKGPGIDPADHDKLFKKFVRLGAQPTGGESSTGLGLSIVRKLVTAMNGRVWCKSSVGKGATFIVELPVTVP